MRKQIKRSINYLRTLPLLFLALVAVCCFALPVGALAAERLPEGSFVYVESPTLIEGGVQRIALSPGTGRKVSSANLRYILGGHEYSVPSSMTSEDAVLFEFPATRAGEYELIGVDLAYADGTAESYDLSSQDEPCSYVATSGGASSAASGISTFSAEPEANNDPTETTVYSMGDSGLTAQPLAASPQASPARSSSNQFVVALDPGHGPGSSNPGAVSHGLREADLTLSVANYCKAALEKYPGVKVIMTHDGVTGTDNLYTRVNDAADAGADVFISFHMNSAGPTAHGAEVWYPNGSSYKRDEVAMGVTLSSNILNRLQALGLYSRGAKTRDYPAGESSSVYPDGSTSDYYGIIRYARQRGILGIIIEHAFVTNDSDAAFLAKESNLKALGEADAEGIARTYGLRTNGSWSWTGSCWQYYAGSSRLTGWFWVTGKRYYADASGNVQNPGWLLKNNDWYWFDQSCANVTGWADINGARYYFDHNGVMKTGLVTIDGSTYYFDASGAMQTGWQTVNGKRRFFDDKGVECVSRWCLAPDGAWYYFDSDGGMATGWRAIGGVWYWFDTNSGRMATGWVAVGSQRYYLNASGAMQTGWILVDGVWYYADGSGVILTGWQVIGGAWYWLDPQTGTMATGWHNTGNSWSRFEESGHWLGYAGNGWNLIDGTWYWTEGPGVPRTGWLNRGDTWYWLDAETGAACTGWGYVNGSWYLFDQGCAMLTGWRSVNGTWYYLQGSGAMATGWINLGGTWYWLDPSGAMATNWRLVGESWYLFDAGGGMLTGWQNLGGTWYYLNGSGAMVTGTQTIEGKRYLFADSGAYIREVPAETKPAETHKSGWVLDAGDWYYYDADGSLHKGWLYVNNTWYYLNDQGVMAMGWALVGGGWYYFDQSGAMQTGWKYVGDAWYELSSSGLWTGAQQSQVTVAGASSRSKADFVSKAVVAFASSGATYPSAALVAGGAATIQDFCGQLYEEATDEGIRPELVFCQAMKETGWLRFGGRVTVNQFNFAGIGAVDGGTTSASFSSVREGLRAQVQHLRVYAVRGVTTSSLAHPCVDPRFSLVSSGCAQYVQWLGIKENPQGRGWATASGYGCSIVSMMNSCFG